MRKIKFRAYYNEEKRFLYFDGDGFPTDAHSGFTWDAFYKDGLIEQYTGKKDSNKKELYENDIVKDDDEGILYKVVWVEDWMSFCFEDTDGDLLHADDLYYIDGKAGFDIIGNINENKGLM